MATVIKLKRSTSADSVPTTSDLTDGEVAVNIADKKIYIRHSIKRFMLETVVRLLRLLMLIHQF